MRRGKGGRLGSDELGGRDAASDGGEERAGSGRPLLGGKTGRQRERGCSDDKKPTRWTAYPVCLSHVASFRVGASCTVLPPVSVICDSYVEKW